MAFPQTTPMRPVPGAFFHTPAAQRFAPGGSDPFRRRLYADGSDGPQMTMTGPTTSGLAAGGANAATTAPVAATTASGSSSLIPAGRALPPVENVAPIARAARAINQFLQLDENFPDLDSYCRPGASSEYDLSYVDSPWTPFQKTQMYPIPNSVFSHYNTGQLQTMMGLFADINHAWVVIDNSLFLWDYTVPEPELIGFEDQPHQIHAVALVPPKPGIFVNTITHILVVATSEEIILLGISATPTAAGTKSVALYQTKLSHKTSGNSTRAIVGTSNGRIFFGGCADINVYELYYQQDEKWFSGRTGLINHTNTGWTVVSQFHSALWPDKNPEYLVDIVVDDTRKLLYTLSSASTIRTYHMETPEKLTRVIEKDKTACLRDITHMINVSPLLTNQMKIVSISPITAREASKLHLMALTNTGCRMFLSATSSASYMIGASSNLAPQSMQVQFVKFPPSERAGRGSSELGIDLQSRALEVSRQGSRFAPGYFIDFVSKDTNPNEDILFVSSPETGRIKNTSPTSPLKYYEHGCWIEVGSRAEAVGLVTRPFVAARHPVGFGNELAVQFDDAPSEFAVLTNTGVHIIRRRRLVDIFAAAIRVAAGEEGLEKETRKFIQSYGRVETISTALAVACGHGGDTRSGTARALDLTTQDLARTVFVEYGGQPTVTEADGTPLSTDSVRLSSRHDALALYISRLIRSLWKSGVVTTSANPAGGVAVYSTVPLPKLVSIQENLERLRRFLDNNRGFIQGLSGPSDLQRAASKQEELALQAEHQALHALQKLMEGITEGISFVLMLFDERVSDIYARLDDTARLQLRDLTYEKLFSQSAGRDLAKLLVKAIVNRNIESGSNVETVADALRRRCGSFCSPDDVVIFKAQEQLKRASEQQHNANQARVLLGESLKLFQRVAGNLSYANLQAAIGQYVDLKYYAGAIQLCLVVAREKDRGNSALSWVNEDRPDNDPRAAAFAERKRCYDLIHQCLQQVDEAASKEPEMVDGKLTLTALKRQEAYDVVNNSDDEVFHFDLYEWYLSQGWTDRIVGIESPHVITFLQRLSSAGVEQADLLCRFYTHRGQFFEAAQVQQELANSDFAIGIKDRITLLSRAKANANVSTAGIGRQQQQYLNHAVTELLEVAHIQDDLLERLKADRRLDSEKRVEVEKALDGQILGLSELYNDYADQAGYHDLCLLIYHAADYHNSSTISQTWEYLIENTHDDVATKLDEAGRGVGSLPQPYEVVATSIQNIAHRTSLDSFIFPIKTLLPMLCQYAVTKQQDATIGADPAWPVQLFISLSVPYEMIVRILADTFDAQSNGFGGATRSRITELIVFTVDAWQREVRRRGVASAKAGGDGGGAALGPWVKELLQRCEAALPPPGSTGGNTGGADLAELRRRLKAARRDVEALMDRSAGASLGFM